MWQCDGLTWVRFSCQVTQHLQNDIYSFPAWHRKRNAYGEIGEFSCCVLGKSTFTEFLLLRQEWSSADYPLRWLSQAIHLPTKHDLARISIWLVAGGGGGAQSSDKAMAKCNRANRVARKIYSVNLMFKKWKFNLPCQRLLLQPFHDLRPSIFHHTSTKKINHGPTC